MLARNLAVAGIAFLMLGIAAVAVSRAEAGPDHYANLVVELPALDSSCMASVAWSGLRGGKPLFIQVRLQHDDGTGYQTSLHPDANQFIKVKQNADYFEVDMSEAAAADPPGASHRVNISFMDRKGNFIEGPLSSSAGCQ